MSTQTSSNNKRIAKNTLLLYFRMLLLIIVQLYTVPIILKALGVEDYGIYNVVGGVVTMFSFIGGSLASGSQRFLAYEIGRKDEQSLKKVFDSTVSIYLLLMLITFVLLEIGGTWFLNTQMNIPQERMVAANWVLQLSVLAFLINLISIPYNAAVIAHERMSLYAYVSILECILKLAVAIALQYILFDKLIVYAILICSIAIIIRIIYQLYCRKHFVECRNFHFSKRLYKGKELLVYSGWNMVGSIAIISRQQGVNIVINIFFGPLLNAAHSIAQQINGVLSQFINNVYMATRPQITKQYAANEMDSMWNLTFRSSKLAFYLMTIISIPILIEIKYILDFWLHDVPPYTVSIAVMMILTMLIETLVCQICAVFQAANKIKRYQIFSSIITLLNLPLSYILLKINSTNPIIPYIVSVTLSCVYVISILHIAKKDVGLNIMQYFKKVVAKNIFVFVIIFVAVFISTSSFSSSMLRVILTSCLSIIYSCAIIWTIGIDSIEKKIIKRIIKYRIYRK